MNKKKRIIRIIVNSLTSLRLLTIPLILYFIFSDRIMLSIITMFISFATDFFDGMIARTFNATTNFGSKFDTIADVSLSAAIIASVLITRISVFSTFMLILLGMILLAGIFMITLSSIKKITAKTLHNKGFRGGFVILPITVVFILLNLPYTELMIYATLLIYLAAETIMIFNVIRTKKRN